MRFLLFAIFLSLCIRKFCFVTPDGISITLRKPDIGNCKENFVFSALYVRRKAYFDTSRRFSCCGFILLILSGDIELNPGPTSNLFQQKGIKIVHQNIRGLFNNLSNLKCFIDENKNVDIITLSETHIQSNSHLNIDSLYDLEGYKFVKRNRTAGIGGGVACYVEITFAGGGELT